MQKKYFLTLFTAILTTVSLTVNASVLGTSLIDGYTKDIAQGTEFTHNTWYSDQSGVGQQTENYITYSPSSDVEPIISGGNYLYGKSNADTEIKRLRNLGINPVAGINADFFSLQTGLPMSNVISDGVIITKDGTKQYGIGINQDNTAFMSEFTLYSVLEKSDGTKTNIYNINKYRQPYSIYMMTDIFSNETHNNTDGIDVILGSVEGEMKIGKKITATVESVDEYAGSIAIPKGKIILTVDKNAPEEFYNPVASLEIGEQITISFGVEGDERWKNAKAGIGATGGMLLKDGTVNPSLDAGANPRTALGIKSDGSLLMYTIDGRQSGYSYGVQLKTLANRLKELGCTDAINLDGGGSTTFVAQFPGDDYMSLINRPSDGSQRAVANFIFLKNNLPKTGILNKITIYPLTSYILKGASLQFSAKGSDTSYYPADTPNLQYYVQSEKESTVDSNGIFTAKDSGIVTLYASSNQVTGSTNVNCIETPTSIDILNESNGKNVSEITIMRNSSINLTASAYAGYNKVTANDGCFNWSCDENIGTIDQNGNFTANNVIFAKGNIYVNAGEKTTAIPVSVTANGKETDEELQTLISIDTSAENTLISFKSNFGLKVNKDDIIIRADGEDIDFEYNSDKETASVVIPYEKTKLTVFATNSLGKTSFKTISVSESDYKNPFIDTKNHWAENILSYMYKNKIINGENTLEGTKFNPNKSMTRAEFAVMITNYLKIDISKYNNVELHYNDTEKIPAWALESFKALYSLDILKGASSETGIYANPLNNITRAETATIISRTLPDNILKAQINSPDKSDIADWAYNGISQLISLGAINGYEDGTIKPLKNVTKAEAAKILYSIL